MLWQIWLLIFLIVIFGMIAALILIYQRSRPAVPKLREGDRGFERENRLFTLYQNLEDMMDGFDAYIEQTRAEFEAERIELLRGREEIARMHANILAVSARLEEREAAARQSLPKAQPSAPPDVPGDPPQPAAPAPVYSGPRPHQADVLDLYSRGQSVEQIAETLGISRNEAALTLWVAREG